VVVESWKRYRRGSVESCADWRRVSKEIGIDESMRKMIGLEGTELVSVSDNSSLLEIASKHPKESIVFYPCLPPPKEEEVEIQVGLAYLHNQAKTSYGYPLFVMINLSKSLYEIYLELF